MKPFDMLMTLLLATIWGLSFLLIQIAAPAFGPIGLVTARMLIAGGALLLYSIVTQRQLPDLRRSWRVYLILGVLNSALPLALEAFAVMHISASLAAILVATVPLFTVLAAAAWLHERLTLASIIGVVLGLGGVAILVGGGNIPAGAYALPAIAAMLAAAILYALGGIYTRIVIRDTSPLALSIGQELVAGLLLLPLVIAVPPPSIPSSAAISAMLILALLMTAGGNMLFFTLIARVGPTRTQIVGFLIPVVALIAGTLFLGEAVRESTLVGLVVIFAGVALVLRTGRPATSEARSIGRTAIGPIYDRHSQRRLTTGSGLVLH